MQCAKCGHNPAAVVTAAWTFEIGRDVKGMNWRVHNVGGSRWRYAAQRDGWLRDMLASRHVHRIPVAASKRRVTLTRLYSGRQREIDRDNLCGGLKSCVDAMVRAELLIGDGPREAEIHYAQERAAKSGLRVLLEEIS
jgi:hypothetical protein